MRTTRCMRANTRGGSKGLARALLLLALLVGCGLSAAAQIAVTVTITGVDAPREPSRVGEGYFVRFEVRVTGANPDGLIANGTVTVDDGEGSTCTKTLNSTNPVFVPGWTGGCTLTTYTPGVKTITAAFAPLNPTEFGSGSDTYEHTVLAADTAVSVASSANPNPSVSGESVTFTATVSAVSPGSGTPSGTVDFYVNGVLLQADVALSGGVATSSARSFTHFEGPAEIVAYYSGDSNYNSSDNTAAPLIQVVEKADTTTTITTSPAGPVALGGGFTVGGTVTVDSPGVGTPTGTVVVSTGSGDSCAANLSGGAWSCSLTSSAVGTTNVTAVYEGNESFLGSNATAPSFQTATIGTTIAVFVSDTPLVPGETATGTVSVQGTSGNFGAAPTGTVTLTHTGNGTLTNTPKVLTASDGGYFEFTYTPTDAVTTPHEITATYVSNDGVYANGSDSFSQAIEKRAANVVMVVSPSIAYISQAVTVAIEVTDDTTAGPDATPTGTATFSDGTKSGVFSSDTKTLSGGTCSVTYTPGAGDAGISTLTATYAGSDVHEGASASEQLTVELRPTKTTVTGYDGVLLVRQPWTFAVEVTDIAPAGTPSDPEGSLVYSSQFPPADVSLSPATGTAPSATFDYTCLGLDYAGAYDLVKADYTPNDGIHARSDIATEMGFENNVAWGQAVKQRPTVTTITNTASTATSVSFTASTVEDPANTNPDYNLTGSLHLLEPSTLAAEGPAASISHDFVVNYPTPPGPPSGSPLVNVAVMFEPSDRVHLSSTDSENIDRSDWFEPIILPPNPQDYDQCTDGCGTGGTDIERAIYALNSTEVALEAVKSALEVATLILDVIPDPVTAAGCVIVGGSTIPVSDIAKAIIAGAGIALDIAILAMDTDLDDDGLPDVIEETITHTKPFKVDSDGDGMGDLDEIDEAGGFYGGTRRPNPNDADSDDDGLKDGDEANLTHTDFCVADTDCDTASDGVEASTGKVFTGLPAPSSDIRDQADPLIQDTDGDGLRDDIEIAYGCPYVNDDDSDDDGLQDGAESWNGDGTCVTGAIGNSSTQAFLTGETDFCKSDTDGDGLTDGEEVALLGGLPVSKLTGFTAVTPRGVSTLFGQEGVALTATIPALDDDSDNDGLSDYEEVTITHTNPLDQDSDNDTLSDANELIAVVDSSWPTRSFIQISDPLDPDSDDDGLPDAVEYPGGSGLGTLRIAGGVPDNTCSYVGDDDSDGDGLQDGHEDLNKNGIFNPDLLGGTGTHGRGETDLCNRDTDGDGLDDGQEEWQLGAGSVNVTSQDGLPKTVPALDADSDDDGLSDSEEVNVTHTDPLDWDTDNDTLSDLNELLVTGGTWPQRTFSQVSDPLDPDTDDDGLIDSAEYSGAGSDRFLHKSTDGKEDLVCPYVNDDDSDNDGLQDGAEDADHDGNWDQVTLGSFNTQATKLGSYWETDPCNPDTDGDGLLDGEEATLLGGGPISQRPATGWPGAETAPGFSAVTPEGASTVLPVGPNCAAAPMYTFSPAPGAPINVTVPALDVDTDNDGLSDYEEVNITGTNPLDADTDDDTITDADEFVATGGAWPKRTFDMVSDPLDINTDDDYLFDPVEGECGQPTYTGTGLRALNGGIGGTRDAKCPYVNNADSDDDGAVDGAVTTLTPHGAIDQNGVALRYTHCEGFADVTPAGPSFPGVPRIVPEAGDGESYDDQICNVCDADSDGDGLTDGEEIGIGTNPDDWDTDNDGRSDWHEVTGGGPIPTDPFDPDTDDDGLLDSVEVFGSNTTNPTNADTDGDGLCDGGAGTPFMVSGDARVVVNPLCKSCSTPGLGSCGGSCGSGGVRTGSAGGIGSHPNPSGYGEDKDGDGSWDPGGERYWLNGVDAGGDETDPNQYDTDGDGDGDGVEVLAFSTSRQNMIPKVDLFGRQILVTYPPCACESGCLDPLNPDSDGDSLLDGYEDLNHDGNFDFATSDFDYDNMPLLGPPQPDPEETNPCDPDTDHDGLTDYEERYQPNWSTVYPFNPTNPLDQDSDNDWLTDGYEVRFTCMVTEFTTLDNDVDGRLDEDPVDGIDNDGDGLVDEDSVDFTIRSVPALNPTDRDSDSDGLIDGLDPDPCNSDLIPYLFPALGEPVDLDGDGFADIDELLAGTSEFDPDGHPAAFGQADLDFDGCIDDRIWLEPYLVCCHPIDLARTAVIDLDDNVLADLRLSLVARSVSRGDFDNDGAKDDVRYTFEYLLSNYRAPQAKVAATVDDLNGDLVIDRVVVERK